MLHAFGRTFGPVSVTTSLGGPSHLESTLWTQFSVKHAYPEKSFIPLTLGYREFGFLTVLKTGYFNHLPRMG